MTAKLEIRRLVTHEDLFNHFRGLENCGVIKMSQLFQNSSYVPTDHDICVTQADIRRWADTAISDLEEAKAWCDEVRAEVKK